MWGTLVQWMIWYMTWCSRLYYWPRSRLLTLFRRKTPLPPIDNDLLLHSATSLAHKIRQKEVRCEAVVQAYITRISAVNPLLNCVVQERFSQALEEAKAIDSKLASNAYTEDQLTDEMPFLGVPITIKESIAVKDMSNNAGRVKPGHRVAEKDASFVQRIKAAGAIPLLVSNTPELCMCWETFNNVTGRTNNPYDIRRSPGGSSGGEAALLGAAASVIGLGSDTCGSGRLPAMFCGVYGHKPSPGSIGVDGHIPVSKDEAWWRFFSIAPLCRYAEDLPLYLHIITEPHKREALRLREPVDIRKIKVFYMEEEPSALSSRVNPEIKTAMRRAVAHFADKYNIIAEKVSMEEMKYVYQVANVVMLRMRSCESPFQKTEDNPEEWNSVILTYLKYFFGCSDVSFPPLLYGPLKKYADSFSDKELAEMTQLKKSLMNKFNEMLGDNGVFLYPTFNDLANFHQQFYYLVLNVSYFSLFNLVELPVCSCPVGLAKDGRPVGFQVAANKQQDRLVFAFAKELEAAFGGWVPPPSRTLKTSQPPLEKVIVEN